MIVTRVFPSFEPEDGRTAVIVGVLDVAVPKAKQFGRDSVTGAVDFVPKVRVIATGTDGEEASGKAGVTRVTDVAVTAVTSASRVTPAAVKVARVVVGSPKKRPPLTVRVVPPAGVPKLGTQKVKKGATCGEGWNAIWMVAVPVSEPIVAVARTVASPAAVEQSAVMVVPPCVTTEMSGRPFCWKKEVDRSVVNATPVPSGTLAPFNVTSAWRTVQKPATGLALLVKSRIWRALEPVPGVTDFGGVVGAGASEEQNHVAAPTSANPRKM
jgi:hypothetical protein